MSNLTPEDLKHLPPSYLAEDVSRQLLDVCIFFIVTETFFFALFVSSRIVLRNYNGIETWFLVPLGYVFNVLNCVLGILLVEIGGSGRHLAYFLIKEDAHTVSISLKLTMAQEFSYGLSIAGPKLAIIALYLRVIREKWARRITWFTGLLIALWYISGVVAILLICHPIRYRWDKNIHGHCGNLLALYRYISIPNLITDMAILILPIPTLLNLQISSTAKKIGVFLTFLTGGMGIITAIIRFVHFYTKDIFTDYTYITQDTQTWTIVEPAAYFLCACLPGIHPILRLIGRSSVYATFTSRLRTRSRTTRRSSGVHKPEAIHLENGHAGSKKPSLRQESLPATPPDAVDRQPLSHQALPTRSDYQLGAQWNETAGFEPVPSHLEAGTAGYPTFR